MRFYNAVTQHHVETDDVRGALHQGLLPSVSTILSVIHSPFFTAWQIKRALDRYRLTGDYEGALHYEDTTAADFGTVCHALLEAHVLGTTCALDTDERHRAAVQPLVAWLEANVKEVRFSEASFADSELGYGGMADLLVLLKTNRLLLCDVKTKKASKGYQMAPDITHKYQLSAYRRHFEKEFGPMGIANLLVASPFGSAPEPCLSVHDYEDRDWTPGFTAAHLLWKEQNGAG